MIYEYDSDLTFVERVTKIAKEIHRCYNRISYDDCKRIAGITNPINDYVTNDDKFDRLYKIMLLIDKDHPDFNHVFNDCFSVYEKGSLSESNKNMMYEIVRYLNNERPRFPLFMEWETV